MRPLILPLLILALGATAVAHDNRHPELHNWFMGLKSKGKMACCDGSEATRLEDADWEAKDGHYRVRLNGEWVDVPDHAVVEEPNLAGPTMVWPYYLDGRMTGVRCFMPGAMI
jgi:hypothetical protein